MPLFCEVEQEQSRRAVGLPKGFSK